jgi:transcription elongation factor Elf1
MSCDICGRGSCTESFHSLEEQERYEKVIDAFEKARDLRAKVRAEIALEEQETEEDAT